MSNIPDGELGKSLRPSASAARREGEPEGDVVRDGAGCVVRLGDVVVSQPSRRSRVVVLGPVVEIRPGRVRVKVRESTRRGAALFRRKRWVAADRVFVTSAIPGGVPSLRGWKAARREDSPAERLIDELLDFVFELLD